jgi:plasmid stabilization system protein ParE
MNVVFSKEYEIDILIIFLYGVETFGVIAAEQYEQKLHEITFAL